MPRTLRVNLGGLVYHVLNRANDRRPLFLSEFFYIDFLRLFADAQRRIGMGVFAFCLMPNHWHMVLRPENDGDLTRFMEWLEAAHAQRVRAFTRTVGNGHVYQGRFKSFVVESDEHLLTVLRYVEQNALRAGLVPVAEKWPWSSLRQRTQKVASSGWPALSPWPTLEPVDWMSFVNRPWLEEDLNRIRESVRCGRPYGGPSWVATTAQELGLGATLRQPGRPRKTGSGTVSQMETVPDPISANPVPEDQAARRRIRSTTRLA